MQYSEMVKHTTQKQGELYNGYMFLCFFSVFFSFLKQLNSGQVNQLK